MSNTNLIQKSAQGLAPKHDLPLPLTFLFAGISSIVGATAVFPLDKVKTRMQSNSLGNIPGLILNNNKSSLKTAWKSVTGGVAGIFKTEGLKGLYKGITPQLIGIVPEKAIKITTNDILKKLLRKYENKPKNVALSLPSELTAGIFTGLIQVFVTNPYELIKIRMQIQTTNERKGPLTLIREIGLRGLYKGLCATMLRDIPFNAIYFSTFAVFKTLWSTPEQQSIEGWKLFMSGIAAGTLAAALDSPADTIKTRLQNGRYGYKGVRDAFTTIVRTEGYSALFKGILPRVLVIAPLFSITFTVFESLQTMWK